MLFGFIDFPSALPCSAGNPTMVDDSHYKQCHNFPKHPSLHQFPSVMSHRTNGSTASTPKFPVDDDTFYAAIVDVFVVYLMCHPMSTLSSLYIYTLKIGITWKISSCQLDQKFLSDSGLVLWMSLMRMMVVVIIQFQTCLIVCVFLIWEMTTLHQGLVMAFLFSSFIRRFRKRTHVAACSSCYHRTTITNATKGNCDVEMRNGWKSSALFIVYYFFFFGHFESAKYFLLRLVLQSISLIFCVTIFVQI